MQQRQLGTHGPTISAIGIGAMSFSDFYGATNEAESHSILTAALNQGVTHIDTADVYGNGTSEEVIGTFLARQGGQKHDIFSIATKTGIATDKDTGKRYFDNTPAYLHQAVDRSLARLGLDHIDLFYIIEKEINKSVASSEIESNDSENSIEVHYKVDNYKGLIDKITNNNNIELLIEENNKISLYKYYDNLKNEYGSFRLSEKTITFNNFSMTALAAIINDLGPFISKIEAKNVSEQWLNTNLSILGNKTPLQAVKYKKYFKKIREIINDLELIYESRTSNDEPFIDPRYVVKRLEINKD